jgi:hypothetical protein
MAAMTVRPRPGAAAIIIAAVVFGAAAAAAGGGDGGMVGVDGTQFVVEGGRTIYFSGFNAYWLMMMASDPARRAAVVAAFTQASARGLNLARTWAFSDGGDQPLQSSPGVYDEAMFQVTTIQKQRRKKKKIKEFVTWNGERTKNSRFLFHFLWVFFLLPGAGLCDRRGETARHIPSPLPHQQLRRLRRQASVRPVGGRRRPQPHRRRRLLHQLRRQILLQEPRQGTSQSIYT